MSTGHIISDSFEFENPNYSGQEDHSKRASVYAEGLNAIDTELIQNETLLTGGRQETQYSQSSSTSRQTKSRQKYAHLGASEMGVPVAGPGEGFSSPVNSSAETTENLREELAASSLEDSRQFHSWRSEGSGQYWNEEYSEADGYNSQRSGRKEIMNGGPASSYYQEGAAVDYSTQDFRKSFAAIDTAARHGAMQPGGGVRVKKEGDTTIVTEHRDPYSFYWQLDQVRKQEEPPPRRQLPVNENVIEEIM